MKITESTHMLLHCPLHPTHPLSCFSIVCMSIPSPSCGAQHCKEEAALPLPPSLVRTIYPSSHPNLSLSLTHRLCLAVIGFAGFPGPVRSCESAERAAYRPQTACDSPVHSDSRGEKVVVGKCVGSHFI